MFCGRDEQTDGMDALHGLRMTENPLVNLLRWVAGCIFVNLRWASDRFVVSSTTESALIDDAERHFMAEAAQALENGAKILLVIDGLHDSEQERVGKTRTHICFRR